MIEKIQIRYFRAHKKIDIEFSPFVNSIIGRNAAGKSTIIRAIRWVVKNKPSGNSVINWDSKKAAVRIIFNKDKITRTRSKTINSYKLNGKEYKAFGNDVPEDIKKAFNLSDINFQGQHEAPFWFCESAGEVSRQLNSIVNLQVIDDTLSNISSGIRKAKTNIEIITDRLKDAEDDRTKLTFVKEMDKELSHIEFIQKVKQGNAVKCSVLSDLLKSVRLYVYKRDSSLNRVLHSKKALAIGLQARQIADRAESLSKLIKQGRSLQRIVSNKPPSLNEIEILWMDHYQTITQKNSLKALVSQAEIGKELLCQKSNELDSKQKEFKKIQKNTCPLCGAKIKE